MVSAARRKLRIRENDSDPKNIKSQPGKSRKRNRSDYQQVEDDIQFLVETKRPKLNIDDSSDDGSSKQSTPSPPTSNNDNNRPTRVVEPETNVSEDKREINRRSPNGFLLPDPLPRGEILTDTIKQEWVLGKPIGVGGFGELYLASFKGQDGKISAEKYVIKVCGGASGRHEIQC